jgi:hypothetical protein
VFGASTEPIVLFLVISQKERRSVFVKRMNESDDNYVGGSLPI